MASPSYTQTFLAETAAIAQELPGDEIEAMATGLAAVRERGGRLFILGVGGGAGHASHAVNDFRKICHLESYTPVDNVSELTARTNDEGWETTYTAWLRTSRLGEHDAILVFSVGGGSREHDVSMNLVHAVELAKEVGASIYGIVGKPDGTTAQLADVCVVVPSPAARRTPHVEAFQAVLWHLLVSHPALAAQAGKWESVERAAPA
ncbi:MAG TPA: SIS domain-containing protein [Solirubrobacteraceae bacterium]